MKIFGFIMIGVYLVVGVNVVVMCDVLVDSIFVGVLVKFC